MKQQATPCYDELNKAWGSTCRVLFGTEVGELSAFEQWLSEYISEPFVFRAQKSALSGKEVFLIGDYCKGKFISFDEVDFSKKFTPLNINEVKDLDSIAEAVQERIYYTGNVVLGNSKFVEESSNIIDSFFVNKSSLISDSKYISHSSNIHRCEYLFGVYVDAETNYTIKTTFGDKNSRCFECHPAMSSRDCYYSAQLENCNDCMFSFGLRSKSCCIGNLPLAKEKYWEIKAKLTAEMAEKLKKDKRIFSLLEIMRLSGEIGGEVKPEIPEWKSESTNKEVIEEAFSTTTRIVLGRELSGIDNYQRFLQKHVPGIEEFKSAISGRKGFIPGYLMPLTKKYGIKNRLVSNEEIWELEKIKLGAQEVESLSFEKEKLAFALRNIAYTVMACYTGKISNIIDSADVVSSQDCCRGSAYVLSKRCGFCFWPRESENIFGSSVIWNSGFCIKAFNSKTLNRAFEVDSCESCSDIYFSHNCENVRDSMFCFNVKNLSYAIGNAALFPDKYREIKKVLLEQITTELEKKKDLKLDIFNIGCIKR